MGSLIFPLFLGAVGLSLVAQVVNYCSGPRTCARTVALALGISATILVTIAGQLATHELRNLVNFVYARGVSGGR
jgi:hypothetical protein